jgi:hypothetical protein
MASPSKSLAQRFKRAMSTKAGHDHGTQMASIDAHDAEAAQQSQFRSFMSVRKLKTLDRAASATASTGQGEHRHKGHVPDYPRAWFYPDLPWGAPLTIFPKNRLRGQSFLLYWEIFTLCWILYISFEVPYRAGYALDNFPVCTVWWRQVPVAWYP